MLRKLTDWRILLVLAMAVALVAAVACGGDDDEEAKAAPEPAPTTAPPAAPAATAAPAPTAKPVAKAVAPAPTKAPAAVTKPAATAVPEVMAKVTLPGAAEGWTRTLVPERQIPPPLPDDQWDKDRVLKWVAYGDPTPLKPWVQSWVLGRNYHMWTTMGLLNFGTKDGVWGGELVQGLALAYDNSPDGMSWVFHLDPEAIFHDGTAVTAAEVKKAWEFSSQPEQQVGWGGALKHTANIAGMDKVIDGSATEASGLTALDDHTLQVDMANFRPAFPFETAVWLMAIYKAQAFIDDYDAAQRHYIGIGPYEVYADIDSGDVELRATKNWWRTPAYIPKVEIRTIGSEHSTHLLMFQNGETDMIYQDAVYQPALNTPGHTNFDDRRPLGLASLWFYGFDTRIPPFDDINVRKAFVHGMDWATIEDKVFPGAEGNPGITTDKIVCFQDDKYGWDIPFAGYEYDPEAAKAFLAASSYKTADNFPPITVALHTEGFVRAAEVMQEQWRENLGVEINIVRLEKGQERPGNEGILRRSAGANIPDFTEQLFSFGHSKGSFAAFTGSNFPDLDRAIKDANDRKTADPGRCAAFAKAEDLLYDKYMFFAGLALGDMGYAVQPWVRNFYTTYALEWPNLPYMSIGKRDYDLWAGK